jgi:osmotically-inducible protein OsmY
MKDLVLPARPNLGPRLRLRLPFASLALLVLLNGAAAAQQSDVVLMKRVGRALRADNRLNGASCYTAAPGVIVLYGTVFDTRDRELAEQVAGQVRGVNQVVNTLKTKTGQWREEEARINDTLLLNDLQNVSVTVVGNQAYLSGQVSTQAEKNRAVRVVESQSNLNINNLIRVVPGPIFSSVNF